jgi:hypothetical protein
VNATNHVLEFMRKHEMMMDADTYCRCNFSLSWRQVKAEGGEYLDEVLDLIESGDLKGADQGLEADSVDRSLHR